MTSLRWFERKFLRLRRGPAEPVPVANVSRPLIGLLVSTLAFFAIWTVALKPGGSNSGGGSQGLHSLTSAVAAARHVAATSGAASAAESGLPTQSGSAAGQTTTAARSGSPAGAVHAGPTSGAAAQSHVPTTSPAGTTAAGASSRPTTTAPSGASPAATSSQVAPSQAALSQATPSQAVPSQGAPSQGAPSQGAPSQTAPTAAGSARLKGALAAHEVVVLLFYNPAGADDQAVKQELDALRARAGVLVLSAPITQLASYSSITEQVPVSVSPTVLFIDRRGQASALTGFSDSLEIAQRLTDTLAVR